MDTKQLATFVTLTEEKTYARAALRLNYAPATLSEHMRALEGELGVKLMCRAGKQSALTPEGAIFLPYARKMLKLREEAADHLRADAPRREPLRVATAESLGQYALINMFREFTRAHEDCEMQLRVGNCAEFSRQLQEGQIDLGYAFSAGDAPASGIESVPLFDEPICLVVHPSHPLARKKSVSPEDFEGQRFAFTYGNCCYTVAFLRQLADKGVIPGAQDYLGSVEMIKRCALDNYGVSLLTACATEKERKSGALTVLSWAGEPLHVQAQMLYSKNRPLDGHMARLMEYTRRYVGRMREG